MLEIKISVIIPVYNAEKFLSQCLDSILSQTLQDWECICVDDGSTDGSVVILEQYAMHDSRFRIFSQVNSGSGLARNRGLNEAKGQYVLFIDPDDFYPNARVFELLYTKAVEKKCVAVGGQIRCVKQSSTPKHEILRALEPPRKLGWVEYAEVQYFFWYTSYIYLRRHLEENKIRFPAFRRRQDPPFLIEVLASAKVFYAISDDVYSYRIRDTECSRISWTHDGGVKLRDALKGVIRVADLADEFGFNRLYVENAKTITGLDAFSTWKEVELAERDLRSFIFRLKRSEKMTSEAWRHIFITLLQQEQPLARRLLLEIDLLGLGVVLRAMTLVVIGKVKKLVCVG